MSQNRRVKLLKGLRNLRSSGTRLNCGQQELLRLLDHKVKIEAAGCHACEKCHELMSGPGTHVCGEQGVYVQVYEPVVSPLAPYFMG